MARIQPHNNSANFYNDMNNWDDSTPEENYGSGLDEIINSNKDDPAPSSAALYQGMGQSAQRSMNAGTSAGQILTGAGASGLISGAMGAAPMTAAGIATGGSAVLGGLAISYEESKKQAQAMNEQAKIQEEQQRKQNTLGSINQLIGVARGLEA
jgi:hypothetical protein